MASACCWLKATTPKLMWAGVSKRCSTLPATPTCAILSVNYSAFNRTGLIKQLECEGFSRTDATYGTDALNADWNEQAALSAQSYLDYSSFSRSRPVIDQQAEFGSSTVLDR